MIRTKKNKFFCCWMVLFLGHAGLSLPGQTVRPVSIVVSGNAGYLNDKQWEKIERYGSTPQADRFKLVNDPSMWIGAALFYNFSERQSVFVESEIINLTSKRKSQPFILDTLANMNGWFEQTWDLDAVPITAGYEYRMKIDPYLQMFGDVSFSWYFGKGNSVQKIRVDGYAGELILTEGSTKKGSPGAAMAVGVKRALDEHFQVRAQVRCRSAFGLILPDGSVSLELTI